MLQYRTFHLRLTANGENAGPLQSSRPQGQPHIPHLPRYVRLQSEVNHFRAKILFGAKLRTFDAQKIDFFDCLKIPIYFTPY